VVVEFDTSVAGTFTLLSFPTPRISITRFSITASSIPLMARVDASGEHVEKIFPLKSICPALVWMQADAHGEVRPILLTF
jgi:hypothetical protein